MVYRLYLNNAASKEKVQGSDQTSGPACGLWVSSPGLVSSLYFQNSAILNMYEYFDFIIHLSVLRCLKIISSAGNKKLCVHHAATPPVSSTWCPEVLRWKLRTPQLAPEWAVTMASSFRTVSGSAVGLAGPATVTVRNHRYFHILCSS